MITEKQRINLLGIFTSELVKQGVIELVQKNSRNKHSKEFWPFVPCCTSIFFDNKVPVSDRFISVYVINKFEPENRSSGEIFWPLDLNGCRERIKMLKEIISTLQPNMKPSMKKAVIISNDLPLTSGQVVYEICTGQNLFLATVRTKKNGAFYHYTRVKNIRPLTLMEKVKHLLTGKI